MRDKHTKKSKGFGFISFKDPHDFMNALKEMNGGQQVMWLSCDFLAVMWQPFNIDIPLYYSVVSYSAPPPHPHQCTFCSQLQCSPTPPPSVYILLSVTMFSHPTPISVHSVVSYNVPPPQPSQVSILVAVR